MADKETRKLQNGSLRIYPGHHKTPLRQTARELLQNIGIYTNLLCFFD